MSLEGVKKDLCIRIGSSYTKTFRWGQSYLQYRDIISATKAAPCIVEATAHGLTAGWPYRIEGALGMTALNTAAGQYRIARITDADHLELNDLNAKSLSPYTGGGTIIYNDPVDLSGATARMHVRESIDDTATAVEFSDSDGTIVIDDSAKTISLVLTEAQTEALEVLEDGVYDLEVVIGGDVKVLARGAMIIVNEVTRE